MNCANCGGTLAPGQRFCQACGTPVPTPATAPMAAAPRRAAGVSPVVLSAIAGVLVLGAIAAGVFFLMQGDDDDDSSSSTAASSGQGGTSPTGGGSSAACLSANPTFVSMLACVPDWEGSRRELNLARAHPLEFYTNLKDVRYGPTTVIGYDRAYLQVALDDIFAADGIKWSDFKFFADAGIPPERMSVVVGGFNASNLEKIMRECKDCPEKSEEAAYAGAKYYTVGDPLRQNLRGRLQPPFYDQLGRIGAMSFNNRAVTRAYSIDLVKRAIDAQKGGASLAKDDTYVAIARELDARKADHLYITDQVQGPAGPNAIPDIGTSDADKKLAQAWNPPASETLLLPYETLAFGQGEDQTGLYMLIILVNADSKTATTNATRLKARIPAFQSAVGRAPQVTSLETSAKGNLTIGVLRGPIANSYLSFFFSRDPLLLFR